MMPRVSLIEIRLPVPFQPVLTLSLIHIYAVRVVSDILESNGSSSMATVCAGTLALMDAGVKLKKPVSGIAMGLISDSATGRWAVLSDILGDEDHLGDMDFKVTGTKDGITATQMDIKVDGLSYEVLAKALEQARVGRMHILGKLTECIAEPVSYTHLDVYKRQLRNLRRAPACRYGYFRLYEGARSGCSEAGGVGVRYGERSRCEIPARRRTPLSARDVLGGRCV